MAASGAPPGWYPDPDAFGGQRDFDGYAWTNHRVAPPAPTAPPPVQVQVPPYPWWSKPPWKGAKFGRPPYGPGSLASPARRLGARVIDGLLLLPFYGAFVTIAVLLVAPHAGPIFPAVSANSTSTQPVPGFLWIELAVLGGLAAGDVVAVAYETIATARFGRTFGKAWLRIRPLRTAGSGLGWARSFGRAALYCFSTVLGWLGVLNPLWCLWDDNHQCLHDKAIDSIVVNDFSSGEPVTDARPTAGAGGNTGQYPGYSPPYGYWAPAVFVPSANGFAVASLVCSIAGFLFVGVPAVLGVIFGFVARSQIGRSSGTQTGGGLATAGIVVGLVAISLFTLLIVVPLAVHVGREA